MKKNWCILSIFIIFFLSCSIFSPSKTELPTSVTNSANNLSSIEKKFIGIWYWNTPEVYSEQSFEFTFSPILVMRPDKYSWREVTDGGTYGPGVPMIWKVDGEFLKFTIEYNNDVLPDLKFNFIDSETLELTDIKGKKVVYSRGSTDYHNYLQNFIGGTWSCKYDAGFGDIKKTNIICNDINTCAGSEKPVNGESSYHYWPIRIENFEPITNYGIYEKDFLKDSFMLFSEKSGSATYAINKDSFVMDNGGNPSEFYQECERVKK